jgi:hypothetical protein
MLKDMKSAQRNRQTHPQSPTGCRTTKRKGILHVIQILKNAHAALIQNLAVIGHAQATRSAIQ